MVKTYPNDGEATEFSLRLRKAIWESGYTYQELGLECDIARTCILSYINHNVEPRVGKLRALCEALGVSADYLIWGEEPYVGDERRC